MDVTFTGNFDRAAINKFKDAGFKGLMRAGEHLLAEADQRVPFDEGILSQSGATTTDPGAKQVAVSYDTPYAARQHEDLSLSHDAGRQAKFLENPLNTDRQKMLEIVAAEYRRTT